MPRFRNHPRAFPLADRVSPLAANFFEEDKITTAYHKCMAALKKGANLQAQEELRKMFEECKHAAAQKVRHENLETKYAELEAKHAALEATHARLVKQHRITREDLDDALGGKQVATSAQREHMANLGQLMAKLTPLHEAATNYAISTHEGSLMAEFITASKHYQDVCDAARDVTDLVSTALASCEDEEGGANHRFTACCTEAKTSAFAALATADECDSIAREVYTTMKGEAEGFTATASTHAETLLSNLNSAKLFTANTTQNQIRTFLLTNKDMDEMVTTFGTTETLPRELLGLPEAVHESFRVLLRPAFQAKKELDAARERYRHCVLLISNAKELVKKPARQERHRFGFDAFKRVLGGSKCARQLAEWVCTAECIISTLKETSVSSSNLREKMTEMDAPPYSDTFDEAQMVTYRRAEDLYRELEESYQTQVVAEEEAAAKRDNDKLHQWVQGAEMLIETHKDTPLCLERFGARKAALGNPPADNEVVCFYTNELDRIYGEMLKTLR